MKFVSIWMGLIVAVAAYGLQLPPFDPNDPNHDKEGLEQSRLIMPILIEGPSDDLLNEWAQSLLDDSRPFQARFLFQQALKINKKSKQAKAGLQGAKDRLDYLEKRYEEFKRQALQGKNPADFGSMAAIRYHQGFHELALEIIHIGKTKYAGSDDLSSLTMTFRLGQSHQDEMLDKIEDEMQHAIMEGKIEDAVIAVGRMLSIGLGNERSVRALIELNALAPGNVDPKAIELIRKLPKILEDPPELGI